MKKFNEFINENKTIKDKELKELDLIVINAIDEVGKYYKNIDKDLDKKFTKIVNDFYNKWDVLVINYKNKDK